MYLDIKKGNNMDRKTKRKLRRELKKMSFIELAGLINTLTEQENYKNDIRNINSIKKKEKNN